jgi:hypothetical protein
MATTPMTQLPSSPGKDSFSRVLMIGMSVFGGGSVVYVVVQLIREEPDKAYRLAQQWGPGYLLALFVAYVVNKLLTRAMEMAQRTTDRSADAIGQVAEQMRSIADAAHSQASAMQLMAEKDDRDKQEMQTLVGVVNSKVDQTLDEQKRQNRALERIEDALKINRPEGSETK